MKQVIGIYFGVLTIVAVTAVSCGQSADKKSTAVQESGQSAKPGSGAGDTAKSSAHDTVQGFSSAPIIIPYLALKNALSADDSKAAATAGNQLVAALQTVDMKAIPSDKHKEYMEITEDVKVNGEHIGESAGKIDHQREHFAALSKDVDDLVTLFGAPQKLYQDFCPMYDGGKGAIWISETKEIRNPFYGSKMPSCGSVKKAY